MLQDDVPKHAGRLRDYLCRPRSQSKLVRRPAVEQEWRLGIHNKAASAGTSWPPASSSPPWCQFKQRSSNVSIGPQQRFGRRRRASTWPAGDISCFYRPRPSPAPQGNRGAFSSDCGLAPACSRTRLWHTSRFLHPLSSQGFIKLPGRKTRPVSHKPSQAVLSPKRSEDSGPEGQLLRNSAAQLQDVWR